jgi:ribosomal subunit interface protein
VDVTITGRNVEITDRFRDYATEKADKITHLDPKALAFEVKAIRHAESRGAKGDDRVELTVICKGPIVRAEAEGSDKYVAFDLAMEKLLERMRQSKDRRKIHWGHNRPTSLREAQDADFSVIDITPAPVELIEKVATGEIPVQTGAEEPEYNPVVIRTKVFPSEHMTVSQAVDRMELVGHDFFLFIDSETDRPSVVYRRKGWDYGVIGLEEQSGDGELEDSRPLRRVGSR